MTKLEFIAACGEVLIDPLIAAENDELQQALIRADDEEVKRILREEF